MNNDVIKELEQSLLNLENNKFFIIDLNFTKDRVLEIYRNFLNFVNFIKSKSLYSVCKAKLNKIKKMIFKFHEIENNFVSFFKGIVGLFKDIISSMIRKRGVYCNLLPFVLKKVKYVKKQDNDYLKDVVDLNICKIHLYEKIYKFEIKVFDRNRFKVKKNMFAESEQLTKFLYGKYDANFEKILLKKCQFIYVNLDKMKKKYKDSFVFMLRNVVEIFETSVIYLINISSLSKKLLDGL